MFLPLQYYIHKFIACKATFFTLTKNVTYLRPFAIRHNGDYQCSLYRMGLHGRECILRALCEAGRRKAEKGTFLQEILYAVFT